MSCAVIPMAATPVGAMTETMYTEHDIKILEFNERDVFAEAEFASDTDEDIYDEFSIKPNRSDI